MNCERWYRYTYRRGNIEQELARPMTAAQAERLGAVLLEDFDPVAARRSAKILVVTLRPDGQFEGTFPIEAEAPAGRLA